MICSSALLLERFSSLQGIVVVVCVTNMEERCRRVVGYVILALPLVWRCLFFQSLFSRFLAVLVVFLRTFSSWPTAPWGGAQAQAQLSGAAWRKDDLVCLQTVLLPRHPTVVFVLWGFSEERGSIMTSFLLSCDRFSSSVVSSRFSWYSSLLPRWSFH